MTFIDNHQVEEISRKLLIDVIVFFAAAAAAAAGLVKRDIYLVAGVHVAIADFRHRLTEWLEIVGDGLVRKEKHPPDLIRSPQSPYDL